MDQLGDLEIGQLGLGMGDDVFGLHAGTLFRHHHGDHGFPEIGMRHADHRAFQYAVYLVEDVFDFLGIDVQAP